MRYKNDKQYQTCHHQIRFLQAQNATKSVFAGALPRFAGVLPRTPLGELTTLLQTP